MEIHLECGGSEWEGVEVRALSGSETIGQLCSYDLDVVCEKGRGLAAEAFPGGRVRVVASSEGELLRPLHGRLGPIRDHHDPSADRRSYRLRVVPRAFRLTLVETQEIYMDMSVPQVIARKLERHGFGPRDFDLRLMKAYPA